MNINFRLSHHARSDCKNDYDLCFYALIPAIVLEHSYAPLIFVVAASVSLLILFKKSRARRVKSVSLEFQYAVALLRCVRYVRNITCLPIKLAYEACAVVVNANGKPCVP